MTKVMVEYCGNPDYLAFHISKEIKPERVYVSSYSQEEDLAKVSISAQRLYRDLQSIEGVNEVTFHDRYQVSVNTSPIFDKQDIIDKALFALTTFAGEELVRKADKMPVRSYRDEWE